MPWFSSLWLIAPRPDAGMLGPVQVVRIARLPLSYSYHHLLEDTYL